MSDPLRRHLRSKLALSILLGSLMPAISPSAPTWAPTSPTVPWLREATFGTSLGNRSRALADPDTPGPGPPDLCHWGRYYGPRSHIYTTNNFSSSLASDSRKDDDGYVGFFHHHNGLLYNDVSAIDAYMCELVRLNCHQAADGRSNTYLWKSDVASDDISLAKKEMVVTVGVHNTFHKLDLRARYIIHAPQGVRKGPVSVDKTFQVIQALADPKNRKTFGFLAATITELLPSYWEELTVLSVIRLFTQLDHPALQLAGLVTYGGAASTHEATLDTVRLLVKFLPRGAFTGSNPAHGTASACGHHDPRKTSTYKNRLVDVLVRIVELDGSGAAADVAITETRRLFYPETAVSGDWDAVILRLMRALLSGNREQEYLLLIHSHLSSNIYTTQLAVVLVDQTKYLLTKGQSELALQLAQRGVRVLPLDFDCWYYLCLCYIMNRNFERALLVLNVLPVVLNSHKSRNTAIDVVAGMKDFYVSTFAERLNGPNLEVVIDDRTFAQYFPLPEGRPTPSPGAKNPPRNTYTASKTATASKFNLSLYKSGTNGSQNSVHGSRNSVNASQTSLNMSRTSFAIPSSSSLNLVPTNSDTSENGDIAYNRLTRDGTVAKIWTDLFLFNPHLRHPLSGNQFTQSPLVNASTRQLSLVDRNLIRLCGPTAAKIAFSAQSSSSPMASIADFDHTSTWGRAYDLLSLVVAIVGWDDLVRIKERVFRSSQLPKSSKDYVVDHSLGAQDNVVCEPWLDQLFLVVYEDLRSLMVIASNDTEQHHSALEWEMLGLLGWSVKYNVLESISALITSVMGVSLEGSAAFDYFGTVKLLEIYNEFVLLDVEECTLNGLTDSYTETKLFSNKLVLQALLPEGYSGFIRTLETEYLSLDFVLLHLMKLMSWNLRWYQYMPSRLVAQTLAKLCVKHDPVFIRGKFRVVFEQNKKNSALNSRPKPTASSFTLGGLFGGQKVPEQKAFEFVETDSIIEYVEAVLQWMEEVRCS